MPQLAPLVLTDRQSTPVDHTFNPDDIVAGVGSLSESSGVPIGDSRVTISLKRTTDRRKPELRLSIPVVQHETINGVTRPTVVRTGYCDIKFNFDVTSSEEERNNLVGMVQDMFDPSNTLVHHTVVKLEGVY